MAGKSAAMVLTAPKKLELREFPIPEIGQEDALLRMEACGICGSDYEMYEGAYSLSYPFIPGHEPLGVIEKIGSIAARRWGVGEGDRVAVEPMVGCGYCRECRSGSYRLCSGGGRSYGTIPIQNGPALLGGYAQYMYLAPQTIVHKVPADIPADIAVMFNPLGAGLRWAVDMPGTKFGDTVVILGPGQRGLASVIATHEAGAQRIIVTGLARDARKLQLAREFGATDTINVEQQDAVAAVKEITGSEMADVVVDVAPYDPDTVTQGLAMVRRGGTVILAGTKGRNPVKGLFSDRIVVNEIRVQGAMSVDLHSYGLAIKLIERRRDLLAKMHTHTLPIQKAEYAIELLAGKIPGEQAIHIALTP